MGDNISRKTRPRPEPVLVAPEDEERQREHSRSPRRTGKAKHAAGIVEEEEIDKMDEAGVDLALQNLLKLKETLDKRKAEMADGKEPDPKKPCNGTTLPNHEEGQEQMDRINSEATAAAQGGNSRN